MVSASEYAVLASAAYARDDSTLALRKIQEDSNGRFKSSDYEVLEGDKDYKVFRKVLTGEVIIACRGTSGVDDANPDLFIAGGVLPLHERSKKITDVVRRYRKSHDDVTITGHSLGGALAAAAAVRTDTMAVTFNQGSSPVDTIIQGAGRLIGYDYKNIIHFAVCNDMVSTSACFVDNVTNIRVPTESSALSAALTNHRLGQFLTLDDSKYTSILQTASDKIKKHQRINPIDDDAKFTQYSPLSEVDVVEYKKILDRTYYDIRSLMKTLSKRLGSMEISRRLTGNIKVKWDETIELYNAIKKLRETGEVINLNNLTEIHERVAGIWGGTEEYRTVFRRDFDQQWNDIMDEKWIRFEEAPAVDAWEPPVDPFAPEGVTVDEGIGIGTSIDDVKLPSIPEEGIPASVIDGELVRDATEVEVKEITDRITSGIKRGLGIDAIKDQLNTRMREIGIPEEVIADISREADAMYQTISLSKMLTEMGMPGLGKGVAGLYNSIGGLKSTVTENAVNAARGVYAGINRTYVGGKLVTSTTRAGKAAIGAAKEFWTTDSIVLKTLSGGKVLLKTSTIFKGLMDAFGWVAQIGFLIGDVVNVVQDDTHIDELRLRIKNGDPTTAKLRWKLSRGLEFAQHMRQYDAVKAGAHGTELFIAIVTTIFAPELSPVLWGGIAAQQLSELGIDPVAVNEFQQQYISRYYGTPPRSINYYRTRDTEEGRPAKRQVSYNLYFDLVTATVRRWSNSRFFTPEQLQQIVQAAFSLENMAHSIEKESFGSFGLADMSYEKLDAFFGMHSPQLFLEGVSRLSQDPYMFQDLQNNGTNMVSYEMYTALGRLAVMHKSDSIEDRMHASDKRNDIINERKMNEAMFKLHEQRFLDNGNKPQGDSESDEEYNDRIDRWVHDQATIDAKNAALADFDTFAGFAPVQPGDPVMTSTGVPVTANNGVACVWKPKKRRLIDDPDTQNQKRRVSTLQTGGLSVM